MSNTVNVEEFLHRNAIDGDYVFLIEKPNHIIPEIEFNNMEELIEKIFYLNEDYNSFLKIGNDYLYNCCKESWRSSYDIWRHCQYYKPDITIFEVMKFLSKNRDLFFGHYCSTISRRVFRLKKAITYGNDYQLYNIRTKDEYGLYLDQWLELE